MVGAASAQVGVAPPGATANSPLACTASAAGTPEMRPEGYTELAGDIVITCTGGPLMAIGAAIPTTNIVVYVTPSVPITSRLLATNGASEAVLIIDEAGANISTGATGQYGPNAPQIGCTTSQEQSTPATPCNLIVGTDNSGLYEVAKPGPGNAAASAQNVFQGKIGDYGVNTVAFYDVPVLPPATAGVSRVFRITNVRLPIPGGITGQFGAFISTNPNQTLPITISTLPIGVVGPAMTAAVKPKSGGFQQCIGQTVALSANLIFTEGFATSFKTRVVPGGAVNGVPGNSTGNTTWAAEAQNLAAPSNENIPGGLYGGFAANTESGFIFPQFTGNNGGSTTYTAGLADYGTRLKAVFYNIPAGLTLYVSTTSGPVPVTTPTFTPGGTNTNPFAVLVATNSGEATPDGSSFSNVIAGTASGSDGLNYLALSTNSAGAATAVWEVTNSNPTAIDSLSFSVYIGYSPTAPTTSNPYGTPITGLPTTAPLPDVQLSFAPEPSQGAFNPANSSFGAQPIPRFAVIKTQEGPWVTINLCQTTLLYPFVTGGGGFDTGIAIANTSWDPFGTRNQQGSCKLYGYGVTLGSSGNTAAQPQISGCDFVANPLPGTNCFPVVPAGQVMSVQASGVLTNFLGYVIAVCNFQYAHGYAAVTDLGLRNLWSSYLALEITNLYGTSRVGVPQGAEALVH